MLYNIIQNWVFLNYLKHVIIKKTLNHTIVNKKCQYQDTKDQLHFYIRKKGDVRKNRVVKAIYLGFSLLKRQFELLIIALTRIVIANIEQEIVHDKKPMAKLFNSYYR